MLPFQAARFRFLYCPAGIILKIIPYETVTLKWVDNGTLDFFEEVIETEHVRFISEEEFNNSLYLSGTAEVIIELRNRIA